MTQRPKIRQLNQLLKHLPSIVKCKMKNAECKIAVCPADTIEIVSEADTIIMHYAFYIHHSKRATMGRPFLEYLTYGYPA